MVSRHRLTMFWFPMINLERLEDYQGASHEFINLAKVYDPSEHLLQIMDADVQTATERAIREAFAGGTGMIRIGIDPGAGDDRTVIAFLDCRKVYFKTPWYRRLWDGIRKFLGWRK
jgi:hypothetical protein